MGRGGDRVLVPSARMLLSTLGQVEVEGEPGFHFPDYTDTLLQVLRCLDVRTRAVRRVARAAAENVVVRPTRSSMPHIRVPGLHGVLVAVKGLGNRIVVPDGVRSYRGPSTRARR